jgi:hypothetical protein
MPDYPRRQQYRRLSRVGETALGSAINGPAQSDGRLCRCGSARGLPAARSDRLGLAARRWLSLARRSRIGAKSEDEVQRVLAPLEAEGWRLRHSLPW